VVRGVGRDTREASAGRTDVTALGLPDGVTAYLCGPLPFMRAVRGDLLRLGLPAHAVHYEVFGPDLWPATEQPAGAVASPRPGRGPLRHDQAR